MNLRRREFLAMALAAPLAAQEAARRFVFRVKVEMVVLAFTVTDARGRYVNGLKPSDIQVFEDGIAQKIVTFSEGSGAPVAVEREGAGPAESEEAPAPEAEGLDALSGANVFILFDTSNIMYRGFTYAQDAVANFVRGLDASDSVAVYSFSRNLSRAVALTRDHDRAIAGLRDSVAGDDTALYNSLLLTVRDAARAPGRKLVVVFSNGPDNASAASPDDVGAVAENEGVPIYIVSTGDATHDPVSGAVFGRLAQATGGKTYWAPTWRQQAQAFREIREDLGNSYTVTYYPAPNPNQEFRRIRVEIAGEAGKGCQVHARPGYRPTKS
jgi:Ca-activated chloride channel homolog